MSRQHFTALNTPHKESIIGFARSMLLASGVNAWKQHANECFQMPLPALSAKVCGMHSPTLMTDFNFVTRLLIAEEVLEIRQPNPDDDTNYIPHYEELLALRK